MNKLLLRFKFYADRRKTDCDTVSDVFGLAIAALAMANGDEYPNYPGGQQFWVEEFENVRTFQSVGVYTTSNFINCEMDFEKQLLNAINSIPDSGLFVDLGVFITPPTADLPEIVMGFRHRSLEHMTL